MAEADLPMVERVGETVHPAFPEDPSVIAERLALFPEGCFVLRDPSGIVGYAVSHPWMFGHPPKLDSHLLRLPDCPDTLFVHDMALLRSVRGGGNGTAGVHRLIALAKRYEFGTLSLVSVSGSARFWQRHGFVIVNDPALRTYLLSYGDEARFMQRPS